MTLIGSFDETFFNTRFALEQPFNHFRLERSVKVVALPQRAAQHFQDSGLVARLDTLGNDAQVQGLRERLDDLHNALALGLRQVTHKRAVDFETVYR